ncbi:LPXTG cell wall anchor domain-containing protein [Sporosarcina sp. NPDC096371]
MVVTVYEVKDSSFVIFNTPFLIAIGVVVGLIVVGIFFFRARKRNNR